MASGFQTKLNNNGPCVYHNAIKIQPSIVDFGVNSIILQENST